MTGVNPIFAEILTDFQHGQTVARRVQIVTPAPPSRPMTMDEWERAGDEYYRAAERKHADEIGDAVDRAGERA